MTEANRISEESKIDLIFHLKWKSAIARHTDGYQASSVNIWRDLLPPTLLEKVMGKEAGEKVEMELKHEAGLPKFDARELFDIKNSRFDRRHREGVLTEPRLGRFYPRGMLKGLPNVYRANVQPFRCVGLNNGNMTVDFNHPLAGKEMKLSVVVGKVREKDEERGGTSNDWIEILTEGPGMQARWQNQRTDYFSDGSLSREDESIDSEFYSSPRFVHHIDETAREMIMNTYGRFLTDNMSVLDLMSSWESHMPKRLALSRAVGLGMNADEMKRNRQLSEHLVHDLNATPALPFGPESFDAVINTVSVEYLTDPASVFSEVSRVLRPNGYFIVTFSNRWFPTKAIRVWSELHEFERMGLVLEYFRQSGAFKDLQTYSIRGLPRPVNDSYFPELLYSDPVYAVWGRKKENT